MPNLVHQGPFWGSMLWTAPSNFQPILMTNVQRWSTKIQATNGHSAQRKLAPLAWKRPQRMASRKVHHLYHPEKVHPRHISGKTLVSQPSRFLQSPKRSLDSERGQQILLLGSQSGAMLFIDLQKLHELCALQSLLTRKSNINSLCWKRHLKRHLQLPSLSYCLFYRVQSESPRTAPVNKKPFMITSV